MIANESASIVAPIQSRGIMRGYFGLNLKLNLKFCITIAAAAIAVASLLSDCLYTFRAVASQIAVIAKGFPYSTPITINNTGTQIWVVNPDSDNNSVTVVDVTSDNGRVIKEIPVGVEPNSIALNGDNSLAYVANTV